MEMYAYISIIEGVLIICMLGWEVFWLTRLYKVLMDMWSIIDENSKAVKAVADSIKSVFNPFK